MSWLSKTLFGSSVPRGQLHAYGKLGFYQDFLSCGPDGAISEEFRGWMDQGFAGRPMGGSSNRVGGPIRLLWRPAEGDQILLAVLRDSADRGGLRRFPFAVYTVMKRAPLEKSEAGLLATATGIWVELERLEGEMLRCPSASDFYSRFGEVQVAAAETQSPAQTAAHFHASLQAVSLPDWLSSLLTSRVRSHGIRVLLVALQTATTNARRTSLRLPLSPITDYTAQMSLWLTMLSSAAGGELPSVLWLPRWDSNGELVSGISFRELDPADAAAFVRPEPDQPDESGWLDLTGEPPEIPSGFRATIGKLDQAMSSPDIPLTRLSAFRLG